MKDHEQFAEDLTLYAMGALDDQQCPELRAHLGDCGECRRELEALRADLAMLALSTSGPQPPERSRRRLMDAIAAGKPIEQSRPLEPGPSRRWPRWLFWAPLAACVLLAVHTVFLWNTHRQARREYEALETRLIEEQKKNSRAQEIIDMLHDPNAQHMTLVSAKSHAQPQVKTIYQRDKGHILLIANNLPELPATKAYQLWLLPATGGKPMPAGTFHTDWRGAGMMLHPMESAGVDAKGFAVTIEPAGGSQTPTPPIVMQPGD
ncbi:MAG TPA: anti-sigma factor [Candidatus Angelobacter sp.]|nr:anti-sigma factor [Candidatus Angelobacter sp.]